MISTLNTIAVCPVCKTETNMTRDHLVPSWFLNDVSKFGISWKELVERAGLQGKMWTLMCGPCNLAKGGYIDYSDHVVRLFMKEFIKEIEARFEYFEAPRKLKVVCGCGRKEPCAVVPGVIAKELIKVHNGNHTH